MVSSELAGRSFQGLIGNADRFEPRLNEPAANETHELVHNLISYSIVVVGTRIDARYQSPQ
jgi:hypothetical protein